MTIQINNTTELLEFIKRDEVTAEQAIEIICTALQLVNCFELTKEEVIKQAEYTINKFYQSDSVGHPIFFGQMDFEFSINDLYIIPEYKKIIDDLEAKY